MRLSSILGTTCFVALSAAFLAASIILTSSPTRADDQSATGPGCSCPSASKQTRPKFANMPMPLDESDEIAALTSLQIGLTTMEDGTPYVWKRANGRLSGIVRPSRTFRSAAGSVCRHVTLMLTTGFNTQSAEGVACRHEGGRWHMEG